MIEVTPEMIHAVKLMAVGFIGIVFVLFIWFTLPYWVGGGPRR